MVKVTIEDVEYNIPQTLKDVTIEQFDKWAMLTDVKTNEDYVKLISTICNIPIDIIMNISTESFAQIANIVQGVATYNFASTGDKRPYIDIDGTRYIINPMEKMTLGEWVDCDAVMKQDENRFAELLAILCRPLNEKYDSDNNEQRIELFKKVTMDEASKVIGFFLDLEKRLKIITQLYLITKEQANQEVKKASNYLKTGDGKRRFTLLRHMTYSRLIKSLKQTLSKC